MDGRKKALAQILGPRADELSKEEVVDALETLSQELIDSVSSGDARGLASALRACVAEIGRGSPESSEPTDGG